MSLRIEYGPIGLAGGLAVQAGQNEGAQAAQQMGLRMAEVNSQANAEAARQALEEKSFELRKAMASQLALAQRMTPAASSVADSLTASKSTKQDQQQQSLAQLDDMLSKGQITLQQYQNARAGVMTGSKALVDKAIMPPDQTDPMQKPIFQAQRQMIHDKRTQLYDQMNEIRKATSDDFSAKPPLTGPGSAVEVQKQIDATYNDEKKLWGDFAPKASDQPAQPTGNIAGYNPNGPVPSSPSAWIGPNAPLGSQGINDLARQLAGPGAAQIGTPPPAMGHPEGTILHSASTNQHFIVKNGQIVPYTPPSTKTATPSTEAAPTGNPSGPYSGEEGIGWVQPNGQ